MKKLILILLVLCASCGSKKEITENKTERSKSDTIRTSSVNELREKGEVIYKTKPVYYQSVIESPCGEDGKIRPINTTIGSGGNTARITTNDKGQISIEFIIDSTTSSLKTEFREKFISDSLQLRKELSKVEVKERIVVRTVWPWWLWVAVIGGVLFAALYVYQKFFIPIKL